MEDEHTTAGHQAGRTVSLDHVRCGQARRQAEDDAEEPVLRERPID
jgi:hypothetical protein